MAIATKQFQNKKKDLLALWANRRLDMFERSHTKPSSSRSRWSAAYDWAKGTLGLQTSTSRPHGQAAPNPVDTIGDVEFLDYAEMMLTQRLALQDEVQDIRHLAIAYLSEYISSTALGEADAIEALERQEFESKLDHENRTDSRITQDSTRAAFLREIRHSFRRDTDT